MRRPVIVPAAAFRPGGAVGCGAVEPHLLLADGLAVAASFAANMNAMWTHVVLGVLVTAVSAWALWDYRRYPHAHV